MSSLDTALQQPAVERDRAHALFGQTMGLVAVTAALFALGAYLGRDLTYGWGFAAYIASFGLLLGLNFAASRSEQLAIGLLFGFGFLVGVGRRRRSRTTPRRTRSPSGRRAGRRRSSSRA